MANSSDDEQFNQLLERLKNDEVESVLASVRADKSLLTRCDEDGNTLLHYSVENTDLCRELLDLGADVNAVNNLNETVLYTAVCGYYVKSIILFCDRGVNVNISRETNFSPLHAASIEGYIKICLFLLQQGADLLHCGGNRNENALEIYGCYAGMNGIKLDKYYIKYHKQCMIEIFAKGPHPSQVQRRLDEKWDRRWPLMNVISGCQIIPLLYKQELALPIDVKIPDEILDSKEKKWMNLLKKVLGDKNLARIVVLFL
jgi:hypothetical protein